MINIIKGRNGLFPQPLYIKHFHFNSGNLKRLGSLEKKVNKEEGEEWLNIIITCVMRRHG
jgi:hypothetical protein